MTPSEQTQMGERPVAKQTSLESFELPDDTLASIGLPAGRRVQVDRTRRPKDGDLVLAELVRGGSRQRLVRRYQELDGMVTLDAAGGAAEIMRWSSELHILGVVDIRLP